MIPFLFLFILVLETVRVLEAAFFGCGYWPRVFVLQLLESVSLKL